MADEVKPVPADWRKQYGQFIAWAALTALAVLLSRLGLPAPQPTPPPLPFAGASQPAVPLVIVVGGPSAPGVSYQPAVK